MKRFILELKIAGINFFLVSAAVSLALLIFAAVAGPLLDFAPIAFEVLLPFYAAIAVGEWGRTRADSSFDAIAAQSRSRFFWTLCRSASVLTVVSLFVVTTMALAVLIRRELPFPTLLALYFPTAFFFSSLAVLVGSVSPQEHTATLVCGLFWLIALLTRSLLRLPGVEFVYPFLCFAGDVHGVWVWNKAIQTAMGAALWVAAWAYCRKK